MKNKIKVYLQYPWKFPDSPYYKSLVSSPPEEVEFKNTNKQKGVITNKKIFLFSNFLKKNIRKWATRLNLTFPNAHLSPKGNYDLIHCAHCLSKNKDKSWVVDIEGGWQLYIGNKNKRSETRVKKLLLDKNCKKIMPWTKEAKRNFLKEFPEIKNKIEVVYPAIPLQTNRKVFNKKINLLFSGRYFFKKGGLLALETIDKLTKKYKDVKAIFVSEIPKNILEKYSKNKKIKFYGLIPQKKLFELYKISDILIYPGYSDSFGFTYLEAMSFGIPIVTVNGFARREIIEEGKTGFVIERPQRFNPTKIGEIEVKLIKDFIKKACLLIENKKIREKISKNCIKEIKEGKFSIKERNKKLKKIYEEAIK